MFRNFSLLTLGVFLFGGCGGEPPRPENDPTRQRLTTLSSAYMQAGQRLGRAPASADEIASDLPPGTSPDVWKSARDGQPFIVDWGTDVSKMDRVWILAYEAQGREGVRLAVDAMQMITEVSPTTSADLPWSPAHKSQP